MLFTGTLTFKEQTYQISLVEKDTARRIDIYTGEVKLTNPSKDEIVLSIMDDLVTGQKVYYGNLDMFYVYERLVREARLFRFKEEEIDEYDDFEEGKVIFVCNQKSERFEYNYKSENTIKVYRYMRTPEATVELTLTDDTYSNISTHLTLPYQTLEIEKSNFNEDSVVLSRIATVSELREKFDLSWLQGKEYVWVDSLEMLENYVKEIKEYALANPKTALLSVDTETTGLDVYNYPKGSQAKDQIVSIILTWKEDFAIYLPIRHKYEKNLPEREVIAMLAPLLEYIPVLTQYGQFDYKVFMGYVINDRKSGKRRHLHLNIKQDLLLENYILQPNPQLGTRSLKDNVWKHLGIKQLSLTDLFPPTKDGGKMDIRFELLPKETALIYGCPDVDLLLKLHRMTYVKIPDISRAIYNIEVAFMPIAAQAEYYGLRINMEEFQREKKLCEELVFQLQEAVYKTAGYRFNLNSPDQVSNFLYNVLGCEKLITSKTNPSKGSTSSVALKNLAKVKLEEPVERFKADLVQEVRRDGEIIDKRVIVRKDDLNGLKYPAVKLLMEYRNYSKLLTSFFNTIEESNKGGRLFNWINQTGAQTGRIISPLQTLPPYIKKMIIPDTSEHGFLIMDYKQVELRLMFGLAKEVEMIKLASNPDNDIHRIAAGRIYQKQLWEIYSDLRGRTKGLNFGIPYWLGDRSLAQTLYGVAKSKEEEEENIRKAREDKRRFFEAMPRVERLFLDARQFIRDHGCMYTLFGRGYYYESVFEETNRGKIARILRQGGNAMIQGLGADTFKKGTTDLEKRIKKRGWNNLIECTNPLTGESEGEYPLVRQSFFVHDELGINYHKKSINPLQVLYEVRHAMQLELPGFPPLFIGPCIVSNWGDAKEDKFEIPTGLLEKWCKEVEQGMHTEPLENPEEWVYNEIIKYKEESYLNCISELAEQLKKEGKPVTPENIGKIFRHDTITHDMIAMYGEKSFEKEFNRKPEHVEHVEWAIQQYIKDNNVFEKLGLNNENVIHLDFTKVEPQGEVQGSLTDLLSVINNTGTEDSTSNVVQMSDHRTENISIYEQEKMELIELADELDEFSNPLDVNVDYDFTDTKDDEYTEGYSELYGGLFTEEEYNSRSEEIKEGFSKYITTVARKKVINVTMVNEKAVKVLVQYLKENHKSDGLYEVSFMQGNNLVDTKIRVDKIDDTFVDLVLSKSSEEIETLFENIG